MIAYVVALPPLHTSSHTCHLHLPLTSPHSVAIMSDAAHMLSDVAGLGVSLFAAWAVTRRSHSSYSFGYHRAEIIGALLSILVIWAVTGALLWEAVQRILTPEVVDGKSE